jgi:hypothetical protein
MRLSASSLERRFSVERLGLLLRNRIYDEAPVVGVGAAVVLGVNVLGLVLGKRAFFNASTFGESSWWIMSIAVAGLLLAGSSLKAMHDGRSEADWLLLPATGVEKYAAALVDAVVIFPLAGALIGVALSVSLALAEKLIGGPGNQAWLPGIVALKAWGSYSVAASVFVAGSASFRKSAFLKTGGLVIAYSIAWSLAVALIILLLVHGAWGDGFSLSNGRFSVGTHATITQGALRAMQFMMDLAVYAGIPAFAILFGAAKVVEKEAKDEVQ